MQTYIHGNFPVFEGFNHMQYQIQNPKGFARMLEKIIEANRLPVQMSTHFCTITGAMLQPPESQDSSVDEDDNEPV